MILVKTPKTHFLLSLSSFLLVPLVFVNLWILNKKTFWSYMKNSGYEFILFAVLASFVGFYFLRRGRNIGFGVMFLSIILLIFWNLISFFSTKNYAIAFFILFLLMISLVYISNLWTSINEPYFRSNHRWYEGKPRPIPKVSLLVDLFPEVNFQISNLNENGVFIFCDKPTDIKDDTLIINLRYGSFTLNTVAEVITKSKELKSFGLRFAGNSPDLLKERIEFLDKVKSGGYA